MSRRPASTSRRGASAAAASPAPWIVGSSYDQFFLWAAWLVPVGLWAVAASTENGLLFALAAFVLLDNSHQVATLPLTVLDPATMRAQAATYLGGAVAIGATAAALSFYPDSFAAKLWASLVVYWGAWHIIRQHYGFLRLYQARDKPADARTAKAEVVALSAGAAFPYFLNLSEGWAAAEGIGKMLYKVPVPSWSPWVVLAVFVAALAVALLDVGERRRQKKAALSRRLLHVLLVVSNFWIGLLWAGRDNILVAVLFITAYHDLQYHGIVWWIGRRRTASPGEPVRPAVRRMFASLGVFALAVFVGALLQAFLRNDFQLASSLLPGSAATTALFAVVNSYAYMHYFFDGKMWKLSRDARLRAELGLGPAAAAPAAA